MKRINDIILITLLSVLFGCNDMDIPPKNILTDDDIFNSESGVTAYITRLYEGLPIESFTYCRVNGFRDWMHYDGLGHNTGEYMGSDYCYGWEVKSGFGYWGYDKIHDVNYLLETLPMYESNFTQAQINQWLGEAYFSRAFLYFGLVKRYGGVPIIDRVQNYPEESIESLKVSRNKEDEVWTFIGEDLDKAIELLPDTKFAKNSRANKYVAAALKSRAMLYAGTIAKYGTVQLDGLIGIPHEKAVSYLKESYAASKLIEQGGYVLYRKNSDKIQNYVDLFFDESSSESILVKEYIYPPRETFAHSYDCFNSPHQMTGPMGWGSANNPTVEWVELFGELKITDNNGNPLRFDNVADFLSDIEPRLRASVLFPGETFRNQQIDVQGGIYESYPDGVLHTSGTSSTLFKGRRVMGLSGLGNDNGTFTGFHMRKYMNVDPTPADLTDWQAQQDWIVFRYAEILLNRAEAACELFAEGETDAEYLQDALSCINDIRDRAGAKQLISSVNELNDIDVVRLERRKELGFENHTWWDFIRWRNADKMINHNHYKTFAPYYIYDENKYIFLKGQHKMDVEWTFPVKLYYEGIPSEEINKNENLLPNNPQY
ncbi:MAG: hypothetical protein PARBA_02504 [Parabacteroides sp.]